MSFEDNHDDRPAPTGVPRGRRSSVMSIRELLFWALVLVTVIAGGPPFQLVLGVMLVVIPALSLISAAYLWRIYHRAKDPSWLFRMFIQSNWRKAVAGAYVGVLTGTFLLSPITGFVIPREVSAPVTGVVALVLVSPPLVHAVTVWRYRRATGSAEPPETA